MSNHIADADKKVQHTPTPWQAVKGQAGYDLENDALGEPVINDYKRIGLSKSNAEIIIRAVNAARCLNLFMSPN